MWEDHGRSIVPENSKGFYLPSRITPDGFTLEIKPINRVTPNKSSPSPDKGNLSWCGCLMLKKRSNLIWRKDFTTKRAIRLPVSLLKEGKRMQLWSVLIRSMDV